MRLRSFGPRIALVALAALGVRLLYILVIAPAPVGVGGDAGFYHSAANLIAQGHFYYREIFGHAQPTAEHPPLYPLLLSLLSLPGATSLLAHRIAGCVLGAVSVALIGLLGRCIGGERVGLERAGGAHRGLERAGGERTGLIAASIAAFYPPLVSADGLVMSEPLFVASVAVALLVGCRLSPASPGPPAALGPATLGPAAQGPVVPIAPPATTGPRPRSSLRWAVSLGGVIGLATLARSEGLLLLPLLAWPLAWSPDAGRARRLIACTVAAAVVLAPWAIRNAVVFHRVTLATDSSTLIAGANCADTYSGHDIGWWSPSCLARGRTSAQLLAGDASAGPGLRYARDHLARLPLVAAVRTLRTFDLFQPLRQGNHEPRRRWVDLVGLAFYFPVLALALVGLALGPVGVGRAGVGGVRAPGVVRASPVSRARTVLLAPILLAVIVSALGWGIGRFRVAADVSLIVLAACALAGLRGENRPRGRHR